MNEPPPASPTLIDAIAQRANPNGFIELPDFISIALYHSSEGYYTKSQNRIGRSARSDFYTSSSLKAVFSEIVTEACVALLDSLKLKANETTFVEIGAEAGASLIESPTSPFASVQPIGIGQPIDIPSKSVVFSNELFDAQSFRQVRFDGKRWIEYGVQLSGERFQWTPRETLSSEAANFESSLPLDVPAGYTVDLPIGSLELARSILQKPWRGAFLAFDYGKSWQDLIRDTPQGSARGYFRHQQLPDILESPGNIDITHHICWDHLEAELAQEAFSQISLLSQEAFIVHRAPKLLQKAFDPSLSAFAPVRRQLKELTHPSLMGQKFQALSAVRSSPLPSYDSRAPSSGHPK